MTADGAQTRSRLLAEARDLYLEVGFAGFSLREVARRTRVSAPAVYRHFEDKEALLREVCSEGFRIFSSYLLRALGASTPRARLLASAEQYLRFGLENPRDYRVIFMGEAQDMTLTPPRKNAENRDPTFQFLVDRVRECMEAGVLKNGDADEIARIIWSHVHGLTSLRLSGHMADAPHFERFYMHAVEKLIAGLR
jgi:AcrR family transcriptional regulator